jgi:hypothetical protein
MEVRVFPADFHQMQSSRSDYRVIQTAMNRIKLCEDESQPQFILMEITPNCPKNDSSFEANVAHLASEPKFYKRNNVNMLCICQNDF